MGARWSSGVDAGEPVWAARDQPDRADGQVRFCAEVQGPMGPGPECRRSGPDAADGSGTAIGAWVEGGGGEGTGEGAGHRPHREAFGKLASVELAENASVIGNFEQFVTRVRPQLDSPAGREIADARNEVVIWAGRPHLWMQIIRAYDENALIPPSF